MRRSLCAFFLAFLAFLPCVAKAETSPAQATKPVEIVATFSILGDFARQVGGSLAHVTTLAGPDGDAHAYKPTPRDSRSLAAADIVIENGLGMEGWVDRLVAASGFKGNVVIASEGVAPRQMDAEKEGEGAHGHESEHPHGGRTTDPHAWQDISNARIYVRNIASALSRARPSESAAIMERAKSYDAELEKLDAWVKSEISAIPAARRKVITSHDAFGYFGAAYGVTFMAPQGLSTEIEPTATEVAKLIGQMKAEKVTRVFFENMASPKLIRQLAKDAGASVGEPVYSDALSKADGPAPTYVAMFRHNVALFKDAMAIGGK